MLIPEDEYTRIARILPISCVDIVVVSPKTKVLLLKRRNEPARGEWWFPGGRVFFGESRFKACERKVREECGLTRIRLCELGTFDLILRVAESNTTSHGITTLFRADWSGDEQTCLDAQSEAGEWRFVSDWKLEKLHPFVAHGLDLAVA